jgi:hypothetical protein
MEPLFAFVIMMICYYDAVGEGGSDCCFDTQCSDGRSCIPCKTGANCSIVGTNIATQVLQHGWWRASIYTTDIRKCWLPAACNRTATTNTTNSVLSTIGSSGISSAAIANVLTGTGRYCTPGYKGPCKYCNYFKYTTVATAYWFACITITYCALF